MTRSSRLPALVLLLLAPPVLAAPPTGKRTPRPTPTHVVVVETVLAAGKARVTLQPGAAVVAARAGTAPRGKVKVTLAGRVEVTGLVDGAALGRRVARDAELEAPDGAPLGTARAGALVRPVAGKAPAGRVLVEAVGPVRFRGLIAADALTAEPRELIYRDDWNARTSKSVELWAARDGQATRARLEAGTLLVGIEQDGVVAHVRTFGAFDIEGWVSALAIAMRGQDEKVDPLPQLIKPTHETFVDTPLYAEAGDRRPIGMLRGGTLVEAAKGVLAGERTKILTRGDAVASGWVRTADLRALEEGVWSDPAIEK